MSLVEVLKSLDELAKAFHEKSASLDKVKLEYTAKLKFINKYIERLPTTSENEDGHESVEDDKLLNQLSSSITCKNCKHIVWDNQQSDLVLIPRKMLKVPEVVDKQDVADRDNIRNLQQMLILDQEVPKSSKKFSSKRVCSYCNKKGHSRAKCYARLTNEKPTRS